MKHFLVVLFILSNIAASYAQMRTRQPQSQPTAQQIEKRKQEAEEQRIQLINNFLGTLEADEFQKQITRQYIDSYVDKKLALLNTQFSLMKEREDAFKNLNETHFLELKELISDDDYQKIQDFITGKYNDKEEKKKKKKEKKKKNKKKEKS